MKKLLSNIFNHHVIFITLFVYGVMLLGSSMPISLSALDPFKKALTDYDATDLIFSKFKDTDVSVDERIVIINSERPDRSEIIEIINRIQKYNPRAIGIDLHFEDFHQDATDTLLRRTLIDNPNVIVVQRLANYNEELSVYEDMVGCHPFFCDSIEVSYSNFMAKIGHTIREYSPFETVAEDTCYSFGTALAMIYDPDLKNKIDTRHRHEKEIINFTGTESSFITVPKEMVLGEEPDFTSTFKDKIVIIGYMGTDEWEESVKDKFFTPLNDRIATKSLPDMFGLTIHANIVRMTLDQNYIDVLSPRTKNIINFLLTFFIVHVFRQVYLRVNPGYWKVIRGIQLAIFATLFLVMSAVMYFFDLKIELGISILATIITWDLVKIYENVILKRQKFFKPSKAKK